MESASRASRAQPVALYGQLEGVFKILSEPVIDPIWRPRRAPSGGTALAFHPFNVPPHRSVRWLHAIRKLQRSAGGGSPSSINNSSSARRSITVLMPIGAAFVQEDDESSGIRNAVGSTAVVVSNRTRSAIAVTARTIDGDARKLLRSERPGCGRWRAGFKSTGDSPDSPTSA